MECDNAVRPLLPERLPADAMVGMLLGDLRAPLALLASDLGDPAETGVVRLNRP